MSYVVLVADDDELVRETAALILEGAGYLVLVARNGEQALQRVREERPHAVLLDMMMPDCDGLEFLDHLRSDGSEPQPVVIAHSGFDRLEGLALARGAAAFLKKPIRPRQLLDLMAMLLRNRPFPPEAAAAHEAAHEVSLANAEQKRESIIHCARLDEPSFRAELRKLVVWLSGYFSAELAVVGLVHCGGILALARSGTQAFAENDWLSLNDSYCPDVTRAATPLIIRKTGAGSAFAGHPAEASCWPYYAGAPLLADEVSLGSLCLRGTRPFTMHAEDMAVLARFAGLVGYSLQDLTARPLGLFRSEGFLAPEHFPLLVESALFRAERDHGAVALAVAEADGIERFGQAISAKAGLSHLVLASLAPGVAAILAEGARSSDAHARVMAGLSAITTRDPVRAAITVHQPGGRSIDVEQILGAALSAYRTPLASGVSEEPAPRR